MNAHHGRAKSTGTKLDPFMNDAGDLKSRIRHRGQFAET